MDVETIQSNVPFLYMTALNNTHPTFNEMLLYIVYTEPTNHQPTESCQPKTPPRKQKKQSVLNNGYNEEEEKEPSPRKILSPRRKSPVNPNFLIDQKVRREQKAKVERLARIQRQMCTDEKKLLHSPSKQVVTGRKKTASPVKTPKCKSPLKVEQKYDEDAEEGFKSPPPISEENAPILLSKSIQTKPDVLTPTKMNQTLTNKLKENVMGYKAAKRIHDYDPTDLLPPDIMEKLNELEQDGKLNDVNDFDVHFRELLGAHCDSKQIASQLLEFMTMTNETNDEIEDNMSDDEQPIIVKSKRPPLPSPKRISTPEIKEKKEVLPQIDDEDISDINESENMKEEEEKKSEIKETPSNPNKNKDTSPVTVEVVEKDHIEKRNEKTEKNDKVLQKEDDLLVTQSQYADASDIDDVNEVLDHKKEDAEEQKSEYVEPLKETKSKLPQQSDSDIIQNWIKKHPEYFFAPSTRSDCEIIKNFASGLEKHDKKEKLNYSEPHSSGHQMLVYDRNKNELLYNDYSQPVQQIHEELNEIMSLQNDVEILTLMESCQALRHKISSL